MIIDAISGSILKSVSLKKKIQSLGNEGKTKVQSVEQFVQDSQAPGGKRPNEEQISGLSFPNLAIFLLCQWFTIL